MFDTNRYFNLTPDQERLLRDYKGSFGSLDELWGRYPQGGCFGWYALVGYIDPRIVCWNRSRREWESARGDVAKVRRVYDSEEELLADRLPVAYDGKILNSGELAAVKVSGKVYAWLKPEWKYISSIGNILGENIPVDGSIGSPTIAEELQRVYNIATGARVGIVFDTTAQLDAWIAGTYIRPDGITVADLVAGEDIYIRSVSDPDYWWDGTQYLVLETKLDLSGYVRYNEAGDVDLTGHKNLILGVNQKILGTKGDRTQHVLIETATYNAGTADEITQTEVGSESIHLNLNTISDISVDTASGRKILAYTENLEDYLPITGGTISGNLTINVGGDSDGDLTVHNIIYGLNDAIISGHVICDGEMNAAGGFFKGNDPVAMYSDLSEYVRLGYDGVSRNPDSLTIFAGDSSQSGSNSHISLGASASALNHIHTISLNALGPNSNLNIGNSISISSNSNVDVFTNLTNNGKLNYNGKEVATVDQIPDADSFVRNSNSSEGAIHIISENDFTIDTPNYLRLGSSYQHLTFDSDGQCDVVFSSNGGIRINTNTGGVYSEGKLFYNDVEVATVAVTNALAERISALENAA